MDAPGGGEAAPAPQPAPPGEARAADVSSRPGDLASTLRSVFEEARVKHTELINLAKQKLAAQETELAKVKGLWEGVRSGASKTEQNLVDRRAVVAVHLNETRASMDALTLKMNAHIAELKNLDVEIQKERASKQSAILRAMELTGVRSATPEELSSTLKEMEAELNAKKRGFGHEVWRLEEDLKIIDQEARRAIEAAQRGGGLRPPETPQPAPPSVAPPQGACIRPEARRSKRIYQEDGLDDRATKSSRSDDSYDCDEDDSEGDEDEGEEYHTTEDEEEGGGQSDSDSDSEDSGEHEAAAEAAPDDPETPREARALPVYRSTDDLVERTKAVSRVQKCLEPRKHLADIKELLVVSRNLRIRQNQVKYYEDNVAHLSDGGATRPEVTPGDAFFFAHMSRVLRHCFRKIGKVERRGPTVCSEVMRLTLELYMHNRIGDHTRFVRLLGLAICYSGLAGSTESFRALRTAASRGMKKTPGFPYFRWPPYLNRYTICMIRPGARPPPPGGL